MLHSASDLNILFIAQSDRLYATAIMALAKDRFPSARVETFLDLPALTGAMTAMRPDLLVVGMTMRDADMLDFLGRYAVKREDASKTLAIVDHCNPRVLLALHRLSIAGAFDPKAESVVELRQAFDALSIGVPYWSASLIARLHRDVLGREAINRKLTPSELILFMLLGDGSPDEFAAEYLKVKTRTVATSRWSIYRKLEIHDRAGLVRLALESGYVRIERGTAMRPGLALLKAERSASRRRRSQTPWRIS